ncbi:MAG: phytanoyl-CoA dioxygenase family protein [Hyphomicrobiaceae bacterium]
MHERMAQDGYLFIRGLLAKDQVTDVRRQMLQILADNKMVRCDRPLDQAVPDLEHFAVEPQPAFMKVLYAQYALEDLNAILHAPQITDVVDAICGEPSIPLPLFVARNIFPARDAYTTPAHQDFVHFQGTTRNYAAWIPMGDCPADMGGLAIASGSHRLGLLDVRPALGAGALEVAYDDELDWTYSELEAGDVLFHNCLTVHRGVPNRSTSMRLSIDCRFQPLSEPMCAQSLRPHRDMVDWEDLYRGWSRDDLKYYWKKHDLKIVPFDWSHYERRDALAFVMAEEGDRRALSTLQRILSNDPDPEKRERARTALEKIEAQAS